MTLSLTTIRNIGTVSLRFKEAPCEITEENYKILQVADYFNSHHNQNYPWLTEEEMNIVADYIKDVSISVVNTVTALYPKPVQDKIKSMVL